MNPAFRGNLIALGGLFLAAVAHAETYDATSDFSLSSNPNGVWSYGYTSTLTSPFILDTASNNDFNGGLYQWRGNLAGDGNPSVYFNPTTASHIGVAPGQLAFHPGPGGELATVRWTAPSAGNYMLTTLFTGIGGGGTDVHVLRGINDLFDGTTSSSGTTANYDTLLSNVAAGETIDLKVGAGNNGFNGDTTGLSAQLVSVAPPVPEPGTVSLLLVSGLTGIAVLRHRRK